MAARRPPAFALSAAWLPAGVGGAACAAALSVCSRVQTAGSEDRLRDLPISLVPGRGGAAKARGTGGTNPGLWAPDCGFYPSCHLCAFYLSGPGLEGEGVRFLLLPPGSPGGMCVSRLHRGKLRLGEGEVVGSHAASLALAYLPCVYFGGSMVHPGTSAGPMRYPFWA